MIDNEKRLAFLAELTELSRKHGIFISGCGCCDSPWMGEGDIEPNERYISYDDGGDIKLKVVND